MGGMLGSAEWVRCSDVWNGWAARTCGISGMLICVGWVGCSDVWNRWDAQTYGMGQMLGHVE